MHILLYMPAKRRMNNRSQQSEVELLLRHAYPFEAEAAKLLACKSR